MHESGGLGASFLGFWIWDWAFGSFVLVCVVCVVFHIFN